MKFRYFFPLKLYLLNVQNVPFVPILCFRLYYFLFISFYFIVFYNARESITWIFISIFILLIFIFVLLFPHSSTTNTYSTLIYEWKSAKKSVVHESFVAWFERNYVKYSVYCSKSKLLIIFYSNITNIYIFIYFFFFLYLPQFLWMNDVGKEMATTTTVIRF